MADKNAMNNKSAMRNKSKVKNKDIAKNKAGGRKTNRRKNGKEKICG